MIIYNVTVNIDNDVHDEWVDWMKNTHIPNVMNTGLFTDNRFCKVLVDEEAGYTYSIQYSCKSMDDLERYQRDHARRLQNEHLEKFKDKFVAFRTLLELVP